MLAANEPVGLAGPVLVTGASGFVGRALCAELLRRGVAVRAAVRSCRGGVVGGCECVDTGDLSAATDWAVALRGVSTVIHLAARVHVMHDESADPLAEFRKVNVAATENLARQAAQSGVRRFVFVSSVKVNGETTPDGARFSESDAANPRDVYALSKWEAEQTLWRIAAETGMEVVALRPPLVYGPGVKGNFAAMMGIVRRGWVLPFASVDNARSLIYVGNLADALIRCAAHPAAAMRTFLVSDGEDLSTPALLRRLGAAIGKPARLLPCPMGALRLAASLIGRKAQIERLLGSLRVDDGSIRRELGWSPPYPVGEGLRATAND